MDPHITFAGVYLCGETQSFKFQLPPQVRDLGPLGRSQKELAPQNKLGDKLDEGDVSRSSPLSMHTALESESRYFGLQVRERNEARFRQSYELDDVGLA